MTKPNLAKDSWESWLECLRDSINNAMDEYGYDLSNERYYLDQLEKCLRKEK